MEAASVTFLLLFALCLFGAMDALNAFTKGEK